MKNIRHEHKLWQLYLYGALHVARDLTSAYQEITSAYQQTDKYTCIYDENIRM